MPNLLLELLSSAAADNLIDFSDLDLINPHQPDEIYQINYMDEKSYKIDRVNITPEELHEVNYNSLSKFMREEILQYHLGKWNNHDASSILINLPSNDVTCALGTNKTNCLNCDRIVEFLNSTCTLDKLTFQVADLDYNNVYNLKDYWPAYGADLSFKPEEGLRIRQTLGLGLTQDIKYVTTKELPSIPSPDSSECLELNSMNGSELLLPSTSIFEVVASPTPSSIDIDNFSIKTTNWTVEEFLKQQEYLNKALPELPNTKYQDRNYYEVNMFNGGRRFEMNSVILEEESDSISVLSNSTTTSLTENNLTSIEAYTFSPTYEFRSGVLDILTEDDITEIDSINLRSNLIVRSNSSNSTTSGISSSTLVDRAEFQNVDWRSGSPLNRSNNNLISDID